MKEIGSTIKGRNFDLKHFREGNGIYTWPDGRIYKEVFKDDLKNG